MKARPVAPRIYGFVQENRVDEISWDLQMALDPYVSPVTGEDVRVLLIDSVREAYRRGVVDGFQQGVAAADETE